MRNNRLYQHIKSGRLYNIIDDSVKVKIDEEWYPAIIYRGTSTDPQVYCRLKDNFMEKFKEMETIGGI